MDIQEIRIDQFGCWQDVNIRSLTPGLNILHLDDGGRPIDFARFLHGIFFGFDSDGKEPAAGAVVLSGGSKEAAQTWTLDRTINIDATEAWQLGTANGVAANPEEVLKTIRGPIDAVAATFLLSPANQASVAERWNWLEQHPDLANSLLGRQSPRTDSRLVAAAGISLKPHGKLIERLGLEREKLVSQIAQLKAEKLTELPEAHAMPEAVTPEVTPAPEISAASNSRANVSADILIAELSDELRMLRRQVEPLKLASQFADRWREWNRLKNETAGKIDLRSLERRLATYKSLEEERRELERKLSNRKRKRVRPANPRTDVRDVRRLLERREQILSRIETPLIHDRLDFDSSDELRHAGQLFESARRENEKLQRQLTEFTRRTDFDWSRLLVEEHTQLKEIDSSSPFADETPAHQLAELKRRRLWIREDQRWLLDRQTVSSQTLIWLAILFTLSVSSLFGTLLVVSPAAKWMLTALGMGGIVSSGALKMSLELRSSQKLNRANSRLEQIDSEILMLTERVLDERQDAASVRRRMEEKMYALQLQQDALEAARRVDSAETSYREMLDMHGLPISYSPREMERALRKRSRDTDNFGDKTTQDPKVARWTKKARAVIQRLEGERPGSDPVELLRILEEISDQVDRDKNYGASVSYEDNGTDRDDVRRELKRIEKQQRAILRKAGVEDAFTLETKIREAKQNADNDRRRKSLEREFTVAIDSHEDADEIRDLLATFDAADIQRQLAEKSRILEETDLALQQHKNAPRTIPDPIPKPPEKPVVQETVARQRVVVDQRALDRARLQLSVIETRIRETMRAAQSGAVLRSVARQLTNTADSNESTLPFLSELTYGDWTSLQPTPAGFALQKGDRQQAVLADLELAELAWLAVQMRATAILHSQGTAMPLVLIADQLLSSSRAADTFQTIRHAATQQVQVLLLVGNRQLSNQLAETEIPVVRVGLREKRHAGPDVG